MGRGCGQWTGWPPSNGVEGPFRSQWFRGESMGGWVASLTPDLCGGNQLRVELDGGRGHRLIGVVEAH